MIDLHLHTKYSDGDYTIRELIDILNNNKVMYASITDHNSIDGIIEYIENNYSSLFNGKMFPGTEIQTIVGDYLIEALVYGYNVSAYRSYVNETRKKFWEFHRNAYKELITRADKMGLKYIEPDREFENGYYCNMKFQEAIQACYEYNKDKMDKRALEDHLYFYRACFQNPESIFFVNNKDAFPKFDDVIKASHECGGIVSLAHIDEYQSITDKKEFLEYLINTYRLDAIECIHPSISAEHEKEYMEFANENGLLVSAGSDFHGPHLPHRKNITTHAKLNETTILKRLI